MKSLLAAAGLMIVLIVAAQPSLAIEQIGKVGQWIVACDWNADKKSATCFAAAITQWESDKVTIFYDPFRRIMTVVTRDPKTRAAIKVDKEPAVYGDCEDGRCVFDDSDFADSLEHGSHLILVLGTYSRQRAYFVQYVTELQRAIIMAKKWMADRKK